MDRAATIPVSLEPTLAEEDGARADWYALIGRLFAAPPDAALLARIAAAGTPEAPDDSALGRAFAELAQACAQTSADAVRAEYDAAFLGVAKPEVILNASYYLSGFLHERPLADLREELAHLGLARRAEASDTEDHLSALAEVMRHLIARRDPAPAGVEAQRAFFNRFLAPWTDTLADALERSGATDFYKHVGRLARTFFAIERQAFDFDS